MSPTMKRRVRVYAFTAGIVVAIMAGIPPLDEVTWPLGVIAVLGLIVGILNIRGEDQVDKFLIAAIGLKVTLFAFLQFTGVRDTQAAVIIVNLEIFITAGLLYVSLARIYESFKANFNSFKVWFYAAAIVLILISWIFGDKISASLALASSLGLLVLGLAVGYYEGPKNPDQANAGVGSNFLIAAVGFQLASSAVATIVEADYSQYEALVTNTKILLEKATIFTTSALLIIAFMAIFWVLDDIAD